MSSAWWQDALSYTLADFLLFSPRTYQRLFALYHGDWWPAQLLALGAGVLLFAALWRRREQLALALLAVAWAWVAWAFHLQRYASINWAATWFAAGFALQALLCLAAAATARPGEPPRPRRAGLALVGAALVLMPAIAPLSGRPWTQAELFGFTPDATVLATLGALLALPRSPAWLWPLPLAWCAVSGATLWAMHAGSALLLPAAGVAALSLRTAMRR